MKTRNTSDTKTSAQVVPNPLGAREVEAVLPFSPLMPWFDPAKWLQVEYQRIEIHLADGGARIQGERMSFRDGKITEEKIEATAPADLYLEAVEQVQRQAKMMVEAMLMPWVALMAPFPSRHHDR